jgi:hypothetical protein
MLLSSGRCDREPMLEALSITHQGPRDVDASAGEPQGEDGLGVSLAFGALAFAEAAGLLAVSRHDPPHSSSEVC